MITKKEMRVERLLKRGVLRINESGEFENTGLTIGRHFLQTRRKSGHPSAAKAKAKRKMAQRSRRINRL